MLLVLQVPNAFQHILAKEKTPTLGNALPAFERMRQTWQQMQINTPETHALIQPGLDKLAEYRHYADSNPTYILATGKYIFYSLCLNVKPTNYNYCSDQSSFQVTVVCRERPSHDATRQTGSS